MSKLTLNRESIRSLDMERMRDVQGGTRPLVTIHFTPSGDCGGDVVPTRAVLWAD